MRFDEPPLSGSVIRFREELNFSDPELVPSIHAWFALRDSRVGVGYRQMSFETSGGAFSADKTFDEGVFPAGDPLRSEFEFREIDLEWETPLYAEGNACLQGGVALRFFGFFPEIESPSVGKESDVLACWVPEFRVRGGVALDENFGLEASLGAGYWQGFDLTSWSGTAEFLGQWTPAKRTRFFVGYRIESIYIESDRPVNEDNHARFLFQGPTAGFSIRF